MSVQFLSVGGGTYTENGTSAAFTDRHKYLEIQDPKKWLKKKYSFTTKSSLFKCFTIITPQKKYQLCTQDKVRFYSLLLIRHM